MNANANDSGESDFTFAAKGVAVSLVNVSVRARGGAALVNDVTLELPAGSATTIIGPSGAGKTTLMRLVAGFIEPSAGAVMFDGQIVARENAVLIGPHARQLGYLPQDLGLWDHLSVAAHLEIPLAAVRPDWPKVRRREEVAAMLERLGLARLARRGAGTLSGGERHRLAIGRALIARPRLLLLDEPFAGLDYGLRDELVAQLGDLRRVSADTGNSFITLLAVTHLREEVLRLTGSVAVMVRGAIVETGSLSAIESAPQTPFAQRFFSREW